MKKSILFLIGGLIIGALTMSFIEKYKESYQTKYIELKEDFKLDNQSLLKKGTLLKIDKAASEGYTRYCLYINYKSEEAIELRSFDKENLIKPYWMYRTDSTSQK